MARCAGIKRDGGRCEAVVTAQQTYCYHHDPAAAEKRKRVAAKGGKSKPNRELAAIKGRLSDLADDVLTGAVDRGDAAVVSQVLNVYLRAVSVELKAKEQQELTERLEELEVLLERQDKGGRYGA